MFYHLAHGIAYLIGLPLRLIWFLWGWRSEGDLPKIDKMVVLAVPHTSNWDFVHLIPVALKMRRRPYATTKHTLFKPPLGWLLRLAGAFPIDREHATNAIFHLADWIKREKRMVLVFTPEGTRSKTKFWKTGFYYTAVKAGVPIILGYIDYKRKRVGLGTAFYPTGDLAADFEQIKAFYSEHGYPLHPENWSELALRPRDLKRHIDIHQEMQPEAPPAEPLA